MSRNGEGLSSLDVCGQGKTNAIEFCNVASLGPGCSISIDVVDTVDRGILSVTCRDNDELIATHRALNGGGKTASLPERKQVSYAFIDALQFSDRYGPVVCFVSIVSKVSAIPTYIWPSMTITSAAVCVNKLRLGGSEITIDSLQLYLCLTNRGRVRGTASTMSRAVVCTYELRRALNTTSTLPSRSS